MADPKNRNLIAERDKRARKERAGGMKRSGGGTGAVKKAQPTRPGRETTTEGDDLYNSAEDRWARMTGTGRYANAPENNWARMTGTGAFADGGGGEERLNRQRMFGGDKAPSVGKKLASRTAKMPRNQRGSSPMTVPPLFGSPSVDDRYRMRGG